MSLRFIENNKNIIFVGSLSADKTHLATSIGIETALHRYGIHFYTCQRIMNDLKLAEDENMLEKELKQFTRYKVLIIDEICYLNWILNQSIYSFR